VFQLPELAQMEDGARSLSSTSQRSANFCRLCWGEQEEGSNWELVSPCGCCGSLKHIHQKCLCDWQQTLRQQGLHRRALVCELCKQPYTLVGGEPSWRQARLPWLWPLERLASQLLAVTRAPSVPLLLLRCAPWRSWAALHRAGAARAPRTAPPGGHPLHVLQLQLPPPAPPRRGEGLRQSAGR
jgi:hypothetical protein